MAETWEETSEEMKKLVRSNFQKLAEFCLKMGDELGLNPFTVMDFLMMEIEVSEKAARDERYAKIVLDYMQQMTEVPLTPEQRAVYEERLREARKVLKGE